MRAEPEVKQAEVRSERGLLTSFLTFLPCFLHLHTLTDHFFQSYVLNFGGKKKDTNIQSVDAQSEPSLSLCWGRIRPPFEGWSSGITMLPKEQGRKRTLSQEAPDLLKMSLPRPSSWESWNTYWSSSAAQTRKRTVSPRVF